MAKGFYQTKQDAKTITVTHTYTYVLYCNNNNNNIYLICTSLLQSVAPQIHHKNQVHYPLGSQLKSVQLHHRPSMCALNPLQLLDQHRKYPYIHTIIRTIMIKVNNGYDMNTQRVYIHYMWYITRCPLPSKAVVRLKITSVQILPCNSKCTKWQPQVRMFVTAHTDGVYFI